MHNVVMEKYKDHIAIIGSGIAGLTIGCILLKEGVPSVIFEKAFRAGIAWGWNISFAKCIESFTLYGS